MPMAICRFRVWKGFDFSMRGFRGLGFRVYGAGAPGSRGLGICGVVSRMLGL